MPDASIPLRSPPVAGGLVPFIAACPLLAACVTGTHAMALAAAGIALLALGQAVSAIVERLVPGEVQVPALAVLVAGGVTALGLALQALRPHLAVALGSMLPLVSSALVLIAWRETPSGPIPSAWRPQLRLGVSFAAVLLALGALRETTGNGSLGIGFSDLLAEPREQSGLQLFAADRGFMLMTLAPGGLVALALMLAARNLWCSRHSSRERVAAGRRSGDSNA